MSDKTAIERLRAKILEGISAPVKASVEKGYIKTSSGGYCVDAAVLNPATLEKTGEVLKEVPLPPLWVGSSGQGLFCPPEADQIVVIGFIDFNRAYPYVAGFADNEYAPACGGESSFVLTDGKGTVFEITDSLFGLLNNSQSLKDILEAIIDGIIAIKTVGPPPQHVLSPDVITSFQQTKLTISQLFKE